MNFQFLTQYYFVSEMAPVQFLAQLRTLFYAATMSSKDHVAQRHGLVLIVNSTVRMRFFQSLRLFGMVFLVSLRSLTLAYAIIHHG